MSACHPEPAVANAQASVATPDNTTVTATYICNAGFSMSGSSRVTCNTSNGTWPTSSLPRCIPIQQDIRLTTIIYVPEIHEEWWLYLLAGLLALIALVLVLWLLCWCCCGVPGCCLAHGTVYPKTEQSEKSYRRNCWCRYCCGLSCNCCCRKKGTDHCENARNKYWMYSGGGQGLASVETPPPREAQLQRPVKPAKDPAKDAKIWMPHSNPVRQINTSTK